MLIDIGPVPDWLVIDAVRYAIGRMTYQVDDTTSWLVEVWDRLPEPVQRQVRCDLERVFRRYEEARTCGKTDSSLGMEMDVRCWERVRNLWRSQP